MTTTPHEAPAQPHHPSRLLVPLALAALYLVWGSTYLAIRVALAAYPPFVLAALRFTIAGALMYGWARARGAASPTRRQWRNAAVTGTLLLSCGNGLVCFAEQRVSSGIAAVAVASMPLFAAVVAAGYGEWPRRREGAGLLIGFLGVVILNLGAGLRGSPSGAIALLLAAALWAYGSVWSRRQEMPAGPMNVAAQMICGGTVLAIVSLATGQHVPSHPALAPTLSLIYLGAAGSIVAFTAYMYLLRAVRPAVATSYAYVNPPVAVLFGVLMGGEHVRALDVVGMAVILAGVAIITLSKSTR